MLESDEQLVTQLKAYTIACTAVCEDKMNDGTVTGHPFLR